MNQSNLNKFPDCGESALGLYPIVDSIAWVYLLLPLGVTTIQLRLKNKKDIDTENEIKQAITFAKKFQARLFINDYWQLAIKYKAYGVHLGQENLMHADIPAIYQAGLRLGISTHNDAEIEWALTIKPSYIACGPVFPTTSKKMLFGPLGIPQLQHWQQTLGSHSKMLIDEAGPVTFVTPSCSQAARDGGPNEGDTRFCKEQSTSLRQQQTLNYPLVAIGGINLDNLSQVLATKVNGIAMISAITQADDPIATTQEFLKRINIA